MLSAATLQELSVRARDGVDVPLEVFEATHPHARVLMLPALGIQARLYRKLGGLLAEAGIPAALDWLQAREPRVPVFLAGHSLGGHLALMARSLHPDLRRIGGRG